MTYFTQVDLKCSVCVKLFPFVKSFFFSYKKLISLNRNKISYIATLLSDDEEYTRHGKFRLSWSGSGILGWHLGTSANNKLIKSKNSKLHQQLLALEGLAGYPIFNSHIIFIHSISGN